MTDTKKIKILLIEKDMSQRDLAIKCGLNKTTVNQIINDKTSPRTDQIEKICAALGVTDCSEKAAIFLKRKSQK